MYKKMLSFGNKKYYLDFDAIAKWCLSSSANPFKEIEINEGYDTNDEGDVQLNSKVIRELKTNSPQDDTIRYDLFKMLVSPFLGEVSLTSDIQENFSYALLFNSLVNMKFLVEIIDE